MSETSKCELCGEPMPEGEEGFKFHGYSGPCPKPPLAEPTAAEPSTAGPGLRDWLASRTIRVHLFFASLYPVISVIPADQWQAMGISSTWSERLPVLIGMIHAVAGGYMRKVTDQPLSGRSE